MKPQYSQFFNIFRCQIGYSFSFENNWTEKIKIPPERPLPFPNRYSRSPLFVSGEIIFVSGQPGELVSDEIYWFLLKKERAGTKTWFPAYAETLIKPRNSNF
jgi:hypothetical protein